MNLLEDFAFDDLLLHTVQIIIPDTINKASFFLTTGHVLVYVKITLYFFYTHLE